MVIDASLTMAWYFNDERTRVTETLFDRVASDGALVPALWRLEVANAFQVALRRKRIEASYRDASLSDLALMPITIDPDTNSFAWSTTLRIAERCSLTLYDAAYLELARRHSVPLATLDRDLGKAATELDIEVLGR